MNAIKARSQVVGQSFCRLVQCLSATIHSLLKASFVATHFQFLSPFSQIPIVLLEFQATFLFLKCRTTASAIFQAILPAAPSDTLSTTLLISFCTVQLRTLCAAHSLATFCLSTTSGLDPREFPGFWGCMVFCHAPIPRKGSRNQQQHISSWRETKNL